MDNPTDRNGHLEMTSAVTGLQLSKEDALRTLTDLNGDAIEFEEKEDGTIISKEIDGSKNKDGEVSYTYTYSLTPQTTIVTVNVAKNPKEDKSKARAASAKEEKEAEKYNTDKDKYQKKSY